MDQTTKQRKEMTREEHKTLIEYLQKIKGYQSMHHFKNDHYELMTAPHFKYINDYLPSMYNTWKDYLKEVGTLQKKEMGEYKKRHGDIQNDYRPLRDPDYGKPGTVMTSDKFMEEALNCKNVEEYETLYNEHGKKFQKVGLREINKDYIGIFNLNSNVPAFHLENNPKNVKILYNFANICLCNINDAVPEPEMIRTYGLEYLKKANERLNNEIKQGNQARAPETAFDKKQLQYFIENGMTAGTPVPPFVLVSADNKFIEHSGFYFEKKNPGEGSIILSKKDAENPNRNKRMAVDALFYNKMIENAKIIAGASEVTPETIKKYEEAASLDRDKARDNKAVNFWHNYRVMCREKANNASDAMLIANEIVKKMPVEEQLFFKREISKYNELNGSKNAYNERLINYYDENVKDLPVNKSIYGRDAVNITPEAYTDIKSSKGDVIDNGIKMRIGETVKMSVSFTDIANQKERKLPPKEYVVASSSAEKNKVVLIDRDNLSKYVMPRDEFIKNVKKYEIRQGKEQKKEKKKEMKNAVTFGY